MTSDVWRRLGRDFETYLKLEKGMAANSVAAVVFDFRGYDTLGESFILLTAIAGSFVILSRVKHKGKEEA